MGFISSMAAATRRPGGGCSSRRASQLHVQEVREAIAAVSSPPACGIQCWGGLEWADSNIITPFGVFLYPMFKGLRLCFPACCICGRPTRRPPLAITPQVGDLV